MQTYVVENFQEGDELSKPFGTKTNCDRSCHNQHTFRNCFKYLGFALILLLLGLCLYALLRITVTSFGDRNKYVIIKGVSLNYRLTNKNNSRWEQNDHEENAYFVRYNASRDVFIVINNTVLNIKVSLEIHVDTSRIFLEKANVLCIIYSDRTEKCKAGLYRPGQHTSLVVEDKVYAMSGSYFKLVVLDLAMINLTAVGTNIMTISQLLNAKESVLDTKYANETVTFKPV